MTFLPTRLLVAFCTNPGPPAPANGQPEGHREDIPPPMRVLLDQVERKTRTTLTWVIKAP
ncbi:hypothetical protein BGY98DRAFT_1102300 [Russula aff. rugulosa BPL654]|nr:hypothetical protein BGY98DRAFT_1102300 [Russula aff. rugulosa BPL654]